MTPPPIPPPKKDLYPAWATSIGVKLKEDHGGKYYEYEHVVRTKFYVYPSIRVEQVNAYVRKPFGYKNKTTSRQENAKSVTSLKKRKVEEDTPKEKKIVKTEEW